MLICKKTKIYERGTMRLPTVVREVLNIQPGDEIEITVNDKGTAVIKKLQKATDSKQAA